MGSKERREREKQEVRERILEAARELFAREGYEAVTMRKVAERIEYSPTAIYLHFKDKVALLRELCTRDFQNFSQGFSRIARMTDPVARLRKVGQAYVAFALEHPHSYQLLFMTRTPPEAHDGLHEDMAPDQGNPERDAYAFLLAAVQDCIDQGAFAPAHRDVDLVAQTLWASLHGVISLRITMGEDPWVKFRPLKKAAETMQDLLIDGFQRRSSS